MFTLTIRPSLINMRLCNSRVPPSLPLTSSSAEPFVSSQDAELPFEDWLNLIGDLSEPLPYDDSTIRIFMDAVAFVLSGFNFIPAERRTAFEFLRGIDVACAERVGQAEGEPSTHEIRDLVAGLFALVIVYQHSRLEQEGHPLPQCTLASPCPYHTPRQMLVTPYRTSSIWESNRKECPRG